MMEDFWRRKGWKSIKMAGRISREDKMVAVARAALSGTAGRNLVLGSGDDCAVIDIGRGRVQLLTVDALVEGTHFDLRFQSAFELGQKAVAVNVSDIAAMGGKPEYLLVSAALNPSSTGIFYKKLIQGMQKACRKYGTKVIGGDLTKSMGPIFLSISAIGEMPKRQVKTRSGCRSGDTIFMTGTPGLSATGLLLLQKSLNLRRGIIGAAIRNYVAPTAKVGEGQALASLTSVHAMMDLSDGLAQDAARMAAASGVGIVIEEEKLPISSSFRKLCDEIGIDPTEMALQGGEDYELLVAAEDSKREIAAVEALENGANLTEIGHADGNLRGLWKKGADGKLEKLKSTGFQHF